MNDKQAAEIDTLMKQHDARTGKLGDDERARVGFAADFDRVCHDLIEPTMRQVADRLSAGGHHATVAPATPKSGAIRFEILPAGAKRERYAKNELPGITLSAEPGMKVGVYSRSGRPDEEHGAGPTRRFRLSEVTPDMITEEILEVLKKTL